MSGGVGEDGVEGSGDEDVEDEEEEPRDLYVSSIKLVDAYPPETGLEAIELIVSVGEAKCV